MSSTLDTMIQNLEKNFGKSLDEWIKIVTDSNLQKHGEKMKLLKSEYGLTHGYANLIVHKSNEVIEPETNSTDDLIKIPYKGKEHLFEIYSKLIDEINKFVGEFEIAPKKSYVSLKRKKQFATLTPATKTRFDIGLNIKNQESQGILEKIDKANSMCSHIIKIESVNEITPELISWLKVAFEQSK